MGLENKYLFINKTTRKHVKLIFQAIIEQQKF